MSTKIIVGDCRKVLQTLDAESVNCCVTSPPYFGLRDYGMGDQIGLEAKPDDFVGELVEVFREVRRVLRDDGTLWLNIGDSYANDGKWGGHTGGKHAAALHCSPIGRNKRYTGLKPKDLIGIPWMVAFALRNDGWYLRQDIVWHKPNPMPESVQDRCTKAHEYVFLLSKSERYYFDAEAVQEESVDPKGSAARYQSAFGGAKSEALVDANATGVGSRTHPIGMREFDGMRNRRSVWSIATRPYRGAHFATMAPELAEVCILAGCPVGGTVLDPFGGAGTTGLVADRLHRDATLIELNPDYAALATTRICGDSPLFAEIS
ncbi:MAG: site-specific DNA-methyltransferase [Polyangiaceae bacterium]